jgi:DNA-binding transcriptional regulator YbjK
MFENMVKIPDVPRIKAKRLVTAHAQGVVAEGMHGVMHRWISAEVHQPNNQ